MDTSTTPPECKSCHPTCASCTGPADNECKTCAPPKMKTPDNECVLTCLAGSFMVNG